MTISPDLRKAAQVAIDSLRDASRENLEARGKNASRALSETLRTGVSGEVEIDATLSALDYWKWTGNGRGPGGMPPVGNIEAWINAKGLSLNAWAVAHRIAYGLKDSSGNTIPNSGGTKDFREKNQNAFEEAWMAWEQGPDMKQLQFATAKAMSDGVVSSFINLQKA